MSDVAEATIALVPASVAPRWLPLVQGQLVRMAEGSGGRFEAQDIARAICTGAMQLWLIFCGREIGAVVLTELIAYPRAKACRLVACVGHERRRWMHLHETIRAWAETQGCTLMEALAPRVWSRIFRPYGYREFHVLLEGAV